jgi:cytochrome c biogenesis protein CcmG/thiol:disulfide interchange protein DsbE
MKVILKFSIVLLIIGYYSSPIGHAASYIRARLGSVSPDFTLESVSGAKIKLSDFRGKVVLLDFWATWCPPCRMSTPALIELNEAYKGKDLVIIGISLDEDKSQVKPFLKREGVKHTVVYGADSSIDQAYRIESIPSFFILDKNGVIRKQFSGYFPGIDREWAEEINLLLKQKISKN